MIDMYEGDYICKHGQCVPACPPGELCNDPISHTYTDTSIALYDPQEAIWFVPNIDVSTTTTAPKLTAPLATPMKSTIQLYHMPVFEGRSVLSHVIQIFDLYTLEKILRDKAVVPFTNGFNIVMRDVMFLPCDTLEDALTIVKKYFPDIEYPLTYREEEIVKPNNAWNS